MSVLFWPWTIVGISVAFASKGTTTLKYSSGFSRPFSTMLTVALYSAAIVLRSIAAKSSGIGMMYSLWASLSPARVAAGGYWFFSESFTLCKSLALVFSIASVFILNLGKA